MMVKVSFIYYRLIVFGTAVKFIINLYAKLTESDTPSTATVPIGGRKRKLSGSTDGASVRSSKYKGKTMRVGIRTLLAHQFSLCKVIFFIKHFLISPFFYEGILIIFGFFIKLMFDSPRRINSESEHENRFS